MTLLHIEKDPPALVMRLMGLFFALFFGVIGALAAFKFDSWRTATWLWATGGVLAVGYYAIPPLRRPLYLGWVYALAPVGWLILHAIMVLIYYGVLTPVGLLMRLFGNDPLARRFERGQRSYWVERSDSHTLEEYFRQY